MRTLVILSILGFASCGRLDSAYLPPNQRTFGPAAPFGAAAPGAASTYSSGSYSSSGPQVPILRLDETNEGDGTYNYAYETGNGISAQEQGDARGEGTRAHGGFSYTAPDGQRVQIQYTADENGFVPQGSHIPTPPPVPEAIARAVAQNLADEARGVVDDGQYRDDGGAGQYRADNSGQYGGARQYSAQGSGSAFGHAGGYKY